MQWRIEKRNKFFYHKQKKSKEEKVTSWTQQRTMFALRHSNPLLECILSDAVPLRLQLKSVSLYFSTIAPEIIGAYSLTTGYNTAEWDAGTNISDTFIDKCGPSPSVTNKNFCSRNVCDLRSWLLNVWEVATFLHSQIHTSPCTVRTHQYLVQSLCKYSKHNSKSSRMQRV